MKIKTLKTNDAIRRECSSREFNIFYFYIFYSKFFGARRKQTIERTRVVVERRARRALRRPRSTLIRLLCALDASTPVCPSSPSRSSYRSPSCP